MNSVTENITASARLCNPLVLATIISARIKIKYNNNEIYLTSSSLSALLNAFPYMIFTVLS